MHHKSVDKTESHSIIALFTEVFSHSEGEQEGLILGNLTAELTASVDDTDTLCFGAYDGEILQAAIFFTRLNYNPDITVFLLSPVAVNRAMQGKGIGQSLIRYGIKELKSHGVNIVVTYGDPAYYGKTGFESLPESMMQAPHKLSMPFGWLGQSLTSETVPTLSEKPRCHPAFNDPNLW